MSWTRATFGTVIIVFVAVGAITWITPDWRVPVVEGDLARVEEARRTLDEVAVIARDNPNVSVMQLRLAYPLLLDLEGPEPSGIAWALLAMAVTFLGILVMRRGNEFGRLLAALGVSASIFGIARAASDYLVRSAYDGVVGEIAFALGDIMWIPIGVVLGPLMLLTLPNGRLLSRGWRWIGVIGVSAGVLLLSMLFQPFRYDGRVVSDWPLLSATLLEVLFVSGIYLWQLVLVLSAASLFIRFRRSVGPERDQLKWVAVGVALSIALLAISDAAQRLGGESSLWGPVASIGFFGVLPLAFLASIFRYRLLEIDLIINKSLVFACLSLLIMAIYVSVIVISGSFVGAGELQSAVIAMVVAAFAFEPLRWRVVRFVDEHVWRRGSQPLETLSGLMEFFRSRHGQQEGFQAIVDGVASATNAASVALWVRDQSGGQLLAASPTSKRPRALSDHDFAVEAPPAIVSVLVAPGDRLRRAERKFVEELSKTAGRYIRGVMLRRDLDAAVSELSIRTSELRAAEKRLRDVVDRTRSDVERDLHDGVQASAVVLATTIGIARVSPTENLSTVLSSLASVEEAVTSFAEGVYPDQLAKGGGLSAAIRRQATTLVPHATTRLKTDNVPEDVAAVAFLVASEAMVNVAKHARGSEVSIECERGDGVLTLVVRDSGPGMAATSIKQGSGLTNMRERVEALGGELLVESIEGTGTSVMAWLPVPR